MSFAHYLQDELHNLLAAYHARTGNTISLHDYLALPGMRARFAREMGVTSNRIAQWLSGSPMNAYRAKQAEQVSGGILKRETLCAAFAD